LMVPITTGLQPERRQPFGATIITMVPVVSRGSVSTSAALPRQATSAFTLRAAKPRHAEARESSMHLFHVTALDEYVAAATSSAPVYTTRDLNDRLALVRQLAFFIVADTFPAGQTSGNINLQVQHSADGRTWIAKQNNSTIDGGGDFPDITAPIGP